MGRKGKRKSKFVEQSDYKHKISKHNNDMEQTRDEGSTKSLEKKESKRSGRYITFDCLREAVSSFESAISRRDPILVTGTVGCGKSVLIDFMAEKFKVIKKRVQISEHTDAKNLLGTYCCTDIPGQFVWYPGPLLISLHEGYWLILEDIDRGTAELQILLSPILKRSDCTKDPEYCQLLHPITGCPVVRHPNFRLIMTRRMLKSHSQELRLEYGNTFADYLDRQSFILLLPQLKDDEIRSLLITRFPSLEPLMDRIMNIYNLLTTNIDPTTNRNRYISLRDLLKFCNRISQSVNSSNQAELIFLNAVDCFLCCVSDIAEHWKNVCAVAGELNLTVEKASQFLFHRPITLTLDSNGSFVQAGRSKLPCLRTADWEVQLSGGMLIGQTADSIVWPFASTRLACTLLERLAVALVHQEPVLLVGETGTGKTSAIQRLAHLCGRRLRVINLNQQSDSVDLMGGFKPVDTQAFVRPIREKFESLFTRTFKMETNLTFLGHINTCFNAGRWHDLLKLMRHPTRLATDRANRPVGDPNLVQNVDTEQWNALWLELNRFERRLNAAQKSNHPGLAFTFIEGAVVQAIQNGDWVLLDEINLAPAEMLDCLSGLLDSEHGSLILTERGDTQPIRRHPDFHLFAAMNPSTDVGKRELPVGLRNRFTEIYVPELDPGLENPSRTTNSPLAIQNLINRDDLGQLAQCYLVALNPLPQTISAVVRLYSALRQAAFEGLVDGIGQRPHFSLRTLCRALMEAGRAHHGSTLRSLYEGFVFSFGSQISKSSRPALETLIRRHLSTIGDTDSKTLDRLLSVPLPVPTIANMLQNKCEHNSNYVNVEGYWLPKGPSNPSECSQDSLVDGSYILTPGVRANLKDLARVVAASGGLPVLLQGETSVGKTSLITYLANRVGQVCYRINNHEHTDQQTYLGTYSVGSATAPNQTQSDSSLSESKYSPALVFKEGLLVQAMRSGHWIILDELNLAPTEILESLNRVLDDNRTIFIPETQQTIKAHPHFRLFATQNPPGLYAGRKMLSRALRNRFIELHFDPIPHSELEIILEKRCHLPASRAHRLVEVMHRLQLARCSSNLFQGKDSFITLRDLFRWAERYRLATCDQQTNCKTSNLFDWDGYLADQGYLLLSGRVRNPEELQVVASAIEAVFKRKVTESRLFDLTDDTSPATAEFLQLVLTKNHSNKVSCPGFEHIVWTRDMRRLLVLVGNAFKYEEPVLLIGETGCGKTTICQLFAALRNQKLHCVNCHQYTEASDFLGGLRPVRHSDDDTNPMKQPNETRLFEWVDGPLVNAMLDGDLFLLDEISLAEDSVLERLNSLLEPERQIHLAERAEGLCRDELRTNQLVAAQTFRFVATMNPGGDYGKKELSPALRNRFTEIWCPTPLIGLPVSQTDNMSDAVNSLCDWITIVQHNLQLHIPICAQNVTLTHQLAKAMIKFVIWYAKAQSACHLKGSTIFNRRSPPTIRDLIAWIDFIRVMCTQKQCSHVYKTERHSVPLDILKYCLHGAALIFVDALDLGLQTNSVPPNDETTFEIFGVLVDELVELNQDQTITRKALENVVNFMSKLQTDESLNANASLFLLDTDHNQFGIDPFFIPTGPMLSTIPNQTNHFKFGAPTTSINLLRLLRAMQLPQRALLLEGSPGVGKTTLVQALARASGHHAIRINLSEATEASDLFGCDLPVEGAGAGIFAWRDGPFLQGLKQGHWIILDEMNLASQSVLECLNACLDHRGEIYIPELGTKFKVKPGNTRLFACQNPIREGGGRKGLPKSFLNRFSQVYFHPLTQNDLEFILTQLYTDLPHSIIRIMVAFNEQINMEINVHHKFAKEGGPWEFNLRDLVRWCDLLMKGKDTEGLNPGLYVHLLYADRMRTWEDKLAVRSLWDNICREFNTSKHGMAYYYPLGRISLFPDNFQCGLANFRLDLSTSSSRFEHSNDLLLLDNQRSMLESLLKVLEMNWMALLVGPPGSGKRTLARIASTLVGQKMTTMYLSPDADTIEFLGALEQREAGGLFTWIDSPLVKGICEGYWVAVENAQLCSPSVLDRLNSLLEPNGELILSERGLNSQGELIRLRPHPEFRLILIVDEQSGLSVTCSGVSRAMRNRGVEIAVPTLVATTQLDLKRLITSLDIDEHLASLLVHFQNMFLHACRDPNIVTHYDHDKISSEDSLLPVGIRKPSIRALISGALYLKQLLNEIEPQLDVSKRQLFEDDETKLESFNPFQKAFVRALQSIYVQRQYSDKASEALNTMILHYTKQSFPHPDSMKVTSGLPNFLTHSLTELESVQNATAYRKLHSRILQMTLSQLPKPLDSHTKLIAQRILLEQANLSDIANDTQFEWPTSSLSGYPDLKFPKWSDWADLRWIPGWRRTGIINSNNHDQTLVSWNRHILLTLVQELIRLSISSHSELKRPITTKSQISLSTLSDSSVFEAAQLLVRGDLPTAWLASYPGLSEIQKQWNEFIGNFLAQFQLTTSHDCLHALFDLFSRARCWLWLFALKPLGPNTEWSDRLLFHNKRLGLTAEDRLDTGLDIGYVKTYLGIPKPLSTPEYQLISSVLSLDWINLGGILAELLDHIQLKTTVDKFDEDDSNDHEFTHQMDDQTIDFETLRCQTMIPLWPLAMITLKHFAENHLSHDQISNNTGLIRLLIKSSLVILTRSNLLHVLAVAQPTLIKDHSQIQKCQQFCSTHGIPTDLADLCSLLDFTTSSRLLCKSFQELSDCMNQPSLINEWRSFGQALHALTWPLLSDYGASSYSNSLTLIGWRQRQQSLLNTLHLLLALSKSMPQIKDSKPLLSSPKALFEQSYHLLVALHKTIGHVLYPDNFEESKITENHLDSDTVVKWIQTTIQPQIKHAQTLLTCQLGLLELAHDLANRLISLSDLSTEFSDVKISLCWISLGCLYLHCVMPFETLDPCLICQIEQEAVKHETELINTELQIRQHMRQITFGAQSEFELVRHKYVHDNDVHDADIDHPGESKNHQLSTLHDSNKPSIEVTTMMDYVEAGLEHPWLAILLSNRHKLSQKADELVAQCGQGSPEVIQMRQTSNRAYSEIRHRLVNFVMSFTENMLLHSSDSRQHDDAYNIPPVRTINRWIEIASELTSWLTEPHRLNNFADIVQPFLFGILQILRGLQHLTHNVLTRSLDTQISNWSSLVSLLTNGLSLGGQVVGTIIPNQKQSGIVLSDALNMALRLASSNNRIAFRHMAFYNMNNLLSPQDIQLRDVSLFKRLNDCSVIETQQANFRLSSYIMDLVWLHCLENSKSVVEQNTHGKISHILQRLIVNLVRPLAQQWHRYEMERKRLSEQRAALYLEADRRRQDIRNQLQHPNKQRSTKFQDSDDVLIDPSLNEELDWRLRFSEMGSLAAQIELGMDRFHMGLSKEDQIQSTVLKLKSVDQWLQTSLNESIKSWVPEDSELVYFINRLIGLLLSSSCCQSMITSLEMSQNLVEPNQSSWRGHVMLTGYSLASWILLKSGLSLDPESDFDNLPAYIGLTAHLASHDIRSPISLPNLRDNTKQSDPVYLFKSPILRGHEILDVYQDPIPIQEAERLHEVLKNLYVRVNHLLLDWPGQPSLVQLLNLTQRLQSFKVSDPLMKFITGLEMVFQEIQEWEKNAARHVSLQTQSMEICNLLIEWRKLELKCWLATLDSAEIRSANRCTTLWFNLHNIFLVPSSSSTQKVNNEQYQKMATERCESLIELFEKGPLGEFVHRWHLVASIRAALDFWPGLSSEERASSQRIVGNTVWFYGQFVPYIQQELTNLRRPIEKELKDVVNITKWGDFTRFWSVKTTVDRCKKAIHKQVRAWEAVLQKPVRPLFEAAIRVSRSPCVPCILKPSRLDLPLIAPSELEWLESNIYNHPQWPSTLRRLNTLTHRFRQHTETIALRASITRWTGQLVGGTKVWRDLVHELGSLTEQLASTCPPAHILAQIRSGHKSSQKHKVTDANQHEDEEQIHSARQWYYRFTTLQQRKRLALSQWLKLASSKMTDQRSCIPETECTEDSSKQIDPEQIHPSDSITMNDDEEEEEEEKGQGEECNLFGLDDLPNLGLSYRRGQRQTHTGQMIQFLTFLGGDPWSLFKSQDDQLVTISKGSSSPLSSNKSEFPASININVKSICQHLARLIALRSSLPPIPGQLDSDPETIGRIMTELGGPNNFNRIMGLIDDLLNQCSKPLAVCMEFTLVSKRLKDLVNLFGTSLCFENETITNEVVDLNQIEPGSKRVQKIRNSTHNIDQLIRNVIHQIDFFSNALESTTESVTNFNSSDFEQLFGKEAWIWLVQCQYLLTGQHPKQLLAVVKSNMNQFCTASMNLLSSSSDLIRHNSFLNDTRFKIRCTRLTEQVNHLLQIVHELIQNYRQAELLPFAAYFENIAQLLDHHLQYIRHELDTVDSLSNQLSQQDVEFEKLEHNLIHSMLKSLESLYYADCFNPNESFMSQSEMLSQYSGNIKTLCQNVLLKSEQLFLRLRKDLDQTVSRDVFVTRLHTVRCIYPLMECLSKAVCLRVSQFWNLLSAWFDLSDFTLTVAGRLLTEGFCRPAGLASNEGSSSSSDQHGSSSVDSGQNAEGSGGGGTSLTAQGVDTTGAKDVSQELECQEQIEGLMGDQTEEQAGQDQKNFDESSEGVEMPDDFSGMYEDAPTEEVNMNEDDQGNDEPDDFENKMGDADGPDEVINNDMWASEGEDEDQNDKPNRDNEGVNDGGGVQDDSKAQGPNASDSKPVSTKESHTEEDISKDENQQNPRDNKADSEKNKSNQPKPKNMPKNRATVAGDENQPDPVDLDEEPELNPDQLQQDGAYPAEVSAPENQVDDISPDLEDLPADLPEESGELDENNDDANKGMDEPRTADIESFDEPMDTMETCEVVESENQDAGHEDMDVFPYHSGAGDLGHSADAIGGGGDGGNLQTHQVEDKMDVETKSDLVANEFNESSHTSGQDTQPDLPNCQNTSAGHLNKPQNVLTGSGVQVQSGHRQPQGPKPTSQNRLQDTKNSQKAERRTDILEANLNQNRESSTDPQQKSEMANMFQHMTEDELDACESDVHVYDSANLEQQKSQQEQLSSNPDLPKQMESETGVESENIDSNKSDEPIPTELPETPVPSVSTLIVTNQSNKPRDPHAETGGDEVVQPDPTAPIVDTLGAQRPPESLIFTRLEALQRHNLNVSDTEQQDMNLDFLPPELSLPQFAQAAKEWITCSQHSSGLARQLCEALRLVLEPTKAARLRGDYRTGKRINMRKIIPYLASHFRKDKIWLRRSQPSQREYRILIAVDDSSSMADNLCRQMTFEALTTVVTALNLLEVGRIGVCSFGESVRVLHDLNEPWTPDAGPRVLSQFTFKQSKTSLTQLLHSSMQLMNKSTHFGSSNSAQSQLLLILSDGVFSEDPQNSKLQAVVRLARDSKLFPVCLILDDVRKKHSIFDLRRYSGPGKLLPYMDIFPLPYYVVLRDVAALPRLLADALRQWFELEASFDGR